MPVTIQSAYFGDEVSSRNVTDALNSRITSGQREIPVNSSIIPMLQVGGVVTLTKDDEDKINKDAKEQCNGGADQTCVANVTQTLRRQRLQAKENETVVSTANIVKGRRLTVKLKNEKGVVSEYVIPEGQAFKPDVAVAQVLGKPAPTQTVSPALPEAPTISLPSPGEAALKVLSVVGTMGLTFLYVYSIVVVYRTFTQDNYSKNFVIGLVAVAALFPWSGIFIVFAYNFFPAYFPKTV